MFELVDESSKSGQLFDIILGFSMMDVVHTEVESITFNLMTEEGQLLGYSETMDAQTLRDWYALKNTEAQSSDIQEWRLHQRLERGSAPQRTIVSMKIETSQSVQAKVGYFEMNYMDICISSRRTKDALLLQLKPFDWSINIGELYDTDTPGNCPSVCDYAISGDGSTAVILSTIQSQLVLDILDLRSPVSLTTGDLGRPKSASPTPRHSAHVQVQEVLRGKVFVSISWNGSQIAVTNTSDMKSSSSWDISNRSNAPILYQYDRDNAFAKGSVVLSSGSLSLFNNNQKCKGLDSALGYGKFHMQATTDLILTDENL
ncbi:unnamed protein product [Mortierella alpina]